MISKYMQRAIDLALLATNRIKSNPNVGCVIVNQDRIIGEGFHQVFGEAHAEVNAVQDALTKNNILSKNDEYFITLEPCGHFGKTPPCAELLVKNLPQNIEILEYDSHPITSGKGLEILRSNDIPFHVISEKTGITKKFKKNQFKQKPYVILKWAQSINGFISQLDQRTKISNPYTDRLVHRWRSEQDGILVGRKTFDIDQPKLDNRYYFGDSPRKFVISKGFNPQNSYQMLNSDQNITFITLTNHPNFARNDHSIHWDLLLKSLYVDYGINSLLIEGGAATLSSLINQNEWDEIRVITANSVNIPNGVKAPPLPNILPQNSITLVDDRIDYYTNDGY